MSKIPAALHDPINNAFPQNVCLVGAIRPDGFANISPRGSTQVFDGDTLAVWDRGGRASSDVLFLLVEDGVIDLVLDDAMDVGVVKFSHIKVLLSPRRS